MLHKIKLLIPFFILFALLGLLAQQLFFSKKDELPSALIGQAVPTFALPNLLSSGNLLSNRDLQGEVALLNVWATWCSACMEEHSMLMKIKNQYHIPIYSIVYKDKPEEVKNWLKNNGNPYQAIGHDVNGEAAIELGVYGTPETFVISPKEK